MLNRILKLVLPLILTISVVVPQACARLGEAEESVVSRNKPNAKHTDTSPIGKGCKFYVFQYTKGFYGIGVIDGKVEVETYGVWDDYAFPSELLAKLAQYSVKWDEIDSVIDNTRVFKSEGGEFFVCMGEMKPMKVKRSVTFFTKKWREYGTIL